MKIVEYRGIEGLVFAEVTEDSTENYTTGTVEELAGTSELTKSTDSSSETHYYDNMPAIVIESTGADEVTATVSAIPLETLAKLTGQTYDAATDMFIEGPRENKYFAMGYKTKRTDGTEVYVWRLKGTFSIPESTHNTEDDGTDANGQEITFTGISTTHKFTKTGKGAKAINVEADGKANVTDFFKTVQTPDSIQAKV
jgi:phi13 family phage major tail protein